jgi:hypothetical protein
VYCEGSPRLFRQANGDPSLKLTAAAFDYPKAPPPLGKGLPRAIAEGFLFGDARA